MTLSKGSKEQKEMAQDALNRWWWPSLMMFGPSDSESSNTDQSMKWKIKRFTNDELRQKFLDATVPQANHLNLIIPDKKLTWDNDLNNGEGGYSHGPIDWEEFWRVVKGNGPMAKDRLRARKKAWEEGKWVRDAAVAFSKKKQPPAREI